MICSKRLAAVLVAGVALAGLLPQAAVAASPGPLPACEYGDAQTPLFKYRQWRKTLLDTELRVTRYYVPPHLVPVSEAGIAGEGKVRPLVIEDLRAIRLAARAAGAPIEVASAYRSFARQRRLFEYWVETWGLDVALVYSARAGHSEHQLGTALDFKSKGGPEPWNMDDWATTPAGAWMRKNAWQYGFVMSYPKGKRPLTCYRYEPWHYRYFGRDVARAIHESGLTVREWLWQHGYGISDAGD